MGNQIYLSTMYKCSDIVSANWIASPWDFASVTGTFGFFCFCFCGFCGCLCCGRWGLCLEVRLLRPLLGDVVRDDRLRFEDEFDLDLLLDCATIDKNEDDDNGLGN